MESRRILMLLLLMVVFGPRVPTHAQEEVG